MLEITVKESETYLPHLNKIVTIPSCTIALEHSLISIAKWEARWHIPYLSNVEKTAEQELDYIKCMCVRNVPDDRIFDALTIENVIDIKNYIDNSMTATTFSKTPGGKTKKETVTAETIYYRMFSNNIPIDCQKWHINRLFTLIRVCDLNNSPKRKMSAKETAAWNAEQNAKRRARLNTKG